MAQSGSLFSGMSEVIGFDLASGWVKSVEEAMVGAIDYVGDEYMRAADAARTRCDWNNAWFMHQRAWHYYDLADYLRQ